MWTHPLTDKAGVTYAFEVRALLFGRRFAARLQRINGVSDVRPRRRWVGSSDVHIRFCYHGRECLVWEPFGDNSRWWIGPEDSESPHVSIVELEQAVARLSAWLIW
jgi:hypothetical protein